MDHANRPRPLPRPQKLRHTKERRYSSSEGEDDPSCYGSDPDRSVGHTRSLGLTPNENTISPIENLDETVGRLYSYLSGSEGDIETDNPNTPLKKKPGWGDHGPHSAVSTPSSRSRSSSMSVSDHEECIENPYSHISDTGTLPMPTVPPPPLEAALRGQRFGPAHPKAPSSMTGCESGGHIGNYAEVDAFEDFEPHFLVQTSSGNVFVPPAVQQAPPTPPLPFPRTVPKTCSSNMASQSKSQDFLNNGQPSRLADAAVTNPLMDTSATQSQLSANLDRSTVNPSACLNSPPPSYPSIQNDFRHYTGFSSTSFRVRKQLHKRCTWRCVAYIFMVLSVILAAIVAYFAAMRMLNLTWMLERHPILGNNHTSPTDKVDGDFKEIQYPLGQPLHGEIRAKDWWKTTFFLRRSQFVKFNITIPPFAVIAIYGRRNIEPTHVQYDFNQVFDGKKLVIRNKREAASTAFLDNEDGSTNKQTAFVQNMDSGLWYIFMYNDDNKKEEVTLIASKYDTSDSSCPQNCHGHGDCVRGQCHCFPGFTGWDCSQTICPMLCNGNGIYVHGSCTCHPGWKGLECDIPENECEVPNCNGNGHCVRGRCICSPGFKGKDCSEEVCSLTCVHGQCKNQRCVCEEGWHGALCDQLQCDRRCFDHGYCNNGTCKCKHGWNGRHCSLDGCPRSCNNHGACQLFHDGYRCSCRDGWKGNSCQIAMESRCDDGSDDDNDGLIDCQDPDCCISISCKDNMHCLTSPDPMEILLRKQPPSSTASFYDRMKFLIEDESVQNYATITSFNESQVSVIRGKVIAQDGSPLIGVRVSIVTQPLYGFTLSRELGMFDILVNGGGSVTLQLLRQPFKDKITTVMVPWNQMVTIETIQMTLDGKPAIAPEPGCGEQHDPYLLRPVVLSTWQHTQLGACPSKSAIIPESQVIQESLQIPGTSVYLVYHSSETPGYMSTIMIQLTPESHIPENLAIVHLKVLVEGIVFTKLFEADAGLKFKYAWDRRNAYNQKVYGIVTATVSVGYQYKECKKIYWETQTATMSGYDITSSEVGGWNIDIHHTYNFQEGILHKGDGTNIYLKERPRRVETIMGTGKRREMSCPNCDGKALGSKLMAPEALASGRDGSLYVGDYNYIRKISSSRQTTTRILEMSMPEVPYRYFMTLSPLDGRLYISDYKQRRIIRVKTMGAVRNLAANYELIAGKEEQCVPGDANLCGDGGLATNATLMYPKGIAIDKDGLIYFADGPNIRTIDQNRVIRTIIGSQGQPTEWRPLPCNQPQDMDQVTLHWPTALAISPLDNTLHILDNDMVLKLTDDNKVVIVAGHAPHCPPPTPDTVSLLSEDQSAPKLATNILLSSPQNIAFAPNGHMFIVESDMKQVNRIRVIKTDGRIHHYAGARPRCNCRLPSCKCYDPKEVLATKVLLHSPTSVTVTPDQVVHIADMGNLRILSIVATLPSPNRFGWFEVMAPQTQELYIFNRYGQHLGTKDIVTDQYVYNFTYSVNSYYGKLTKITDRGGNHFEIKRDYTTQAQEIVPPGGQKCKFIMNNMGQLHIFISSDNSTTQFSYQDNSGLLESKQTSEGHTYFYEYDYNGRLSTVIQPTGERTRLGLDVNPSGAITRLSTDERDQVSMATNGQMLSILHGDAKQKVRYTHDGSLVMEYPSLMAVTLETNPHPLLSSQYQLQVKRKVILPNNMMHRLEWRFYLRRENKAKTKPIQKIGRRMRVGSLRSKHGSRGKSHDPEVHEGKGGKVLLVNRENLLTFEYERSSNTETVLDSAGAPLLLIEYNAAGKPTHFLPQSLLHPVNITYDMWGNIITWSRGDLSEQNTYDSKTMQLLERKVGSRAVYRYIYKSGAKPTDVIQPSGKQYLLHYDSHGNLQQVVMPTLGSHYFHTLTTFGFHRQMYLPPDSHSKYIRDYDTNGKLKQILFPSAYRRVTYHYSKDSSLDRVIYDWTDLSYSYYKDSGVLQSVDLNDRSAFNFKCSLMYEPNGALVRVHKVSLNHTTEKLLTARYNYTYDDHFRVISMEATIGNQVFKPVNYSFNAKNGQLEKVNSFTFSYPAYNKQVLRDANAEITKEFDRYGRLTGVKYKFSNYMAFILEMNYDKMNQVFEWRRKIGSDDIKAYEYSYDLDGNLVDVKLDGHSEWAYVYDGNGNIKSLTALGKTKHFDINGKDQVIRDGRTSYVWDTDGFLVQRGNEIFEYNSLGQLVRAFETNKYDIWYYYDGEGKLVARKDALTGYLNQYFYGNIQHKQCMTHMFNHATRQTTAFYYDNKGKLFAMEFDNRVYYVAADPTGTPFLVFDYMGGVVKHVNYDPLGGVQLDVIPQFEFPFGFQGGLYDHVTRLVHLGHRAYDPAIGQWLMPDFRGILENIDNILRNPQIVNLYTFKNVVNVHLQKDYHMTDISSWLDASGFDLDSLIPEVSFSGQIRPSHRHDNQHPLLPAMSAFECAYQRDAHNFEKFTTVPRSKVSIEENAKTIKSFSPFTSIFGDGVLLSMINKVVIVNVLDNVNQVASTLATVLLNQSEWVDVHFTIHGRDLHFFVRKELEKADEDIAALALKHGNIIGNGINVTIHRYLNGHHMSGVGQAGTYIDIRLHNNNTVLNIRYGTTSWKERERLLRHASERAVAHAWQLEKQFVQRKEHTLNVWTNSQKEQLVKTGSVRGYQAMYIRDITQYPMLADDPKNIMFLPEAS